MKKAEQWNLILHHWCLSCKPFSGELFKGRPKLARCWEPLLCFLWHPFFAGFSGRGSCSAPHHTLCSRIVRNEMISSSQQRWKWKGKGQGGKISFQKRFQSIWSFTNLEKKIVKSWFKWFMRSSLETYKTPRRCRELLYWLPVYTLNLWQQSASSVAS